MRCNFGAGKEAVQFLYKQTTYSLFTNVFICYNCRVIFTCYDYLTSSVILNCSETFRCGPIKGTENCWLLITTGRLFLNSQTLLYGLVANCFFMCSSDADVLSGMEIMKYLFLGK